MKAIFKKSLVKNKVMLIGLTLFIAISANAQQSPVYSHFMFNRLAINPAYAGSQDQLNITALHRHQWENFDGAPTTSAFSVHKYIKKKNIGIGMLASSDQIGIHTDNRLYLVYAYKIKMRAGTLSMGLQGGFSRINSDFSKLNLKSEKDALMSGYRSDFNPNFGSGVYFSNQKFFTGFSIPYMLNNQLKSVGDAVSQAQEARYYLLTSGVVLDVSREVKVVPSVLLRIQEGNAVGMDLNANIVLSDILTIGASYRTENAVSALMGLNFSENLSMGYSYDINTSEIGRYSDGTHEFMLNYRIVNSKLCHTYF
ncbi:PorP/SprF family type IX secretion system membrane protein [Catalinimonas niigatensis]|uniref:PorP/SprF family type IX secretion system membrane protein n=1 Tax=Catalinimonas niigatensis TaxID=1397264 RepID=UPI0026661EA6|nr:type IX secretion system membrane protein PorP/SprF [Catalinimonas niigatensis]WPP51157.1 type IX secretion system membrane protein PorP/SprF [Catalinimonas niigatensis]